MKLSQLTEIIDTRIRKILKETRSIDGSKYVDAVAMKRMGIEWDDIEWCIKHYEEIANKVGDTGTCVLGGGLKANGAYIIRSYSQGNMGPETIYGDCEEYLKPKYPKIKFEFVYGNID